MDKLLLKDVPDKNIFIYEGHVFKKLKKSKRSHQRPYDINATMYYGQSRRTVKRGWICEDTEVIHIGNQEAFDAKGFDAIRAICKACFDPDGSEPVDL